MAIDAPADGTGVTVPFAITGWAIDGDAPSGSGVDTVHAWALPLAGGAPIFLDAVTPDLTRADIGAIYGARFTQCGFRVDVASLAPGAYTIAVFAHSTATGTFNQVRTVTVIVD
jgi:hypothetical protein